MKQKIKHLLSKRPRRRKKVSEESLAEAIQGIPRITNETVAEHREEVLRGARKYIYPLQHSAHRVVIISTSLFIVVVLAFFTYTLLALYKFQSTSSFVYAITQVIPFPIAKAGSHFVSYESYLFELRHYMHYYETQQKIDFNTESGKAQLAEFKKRALDGVINDAYVKQLAKEHDVRVNERELNQQITLLREQNRLGSDDQVFSDVLQEFWGWSVEDFKRELRQQMLTQKVVTTLDTGASKRAKSAHSQVQQQGADFGAIAKQVSEDEATKENGGDYGVTIAKSNRDIPPQVIDTLFKLKQGEVSGVINAGNSLEIVTVKAIEGDKLRAAHISIVFKPVDAYLKPLRDKDKPRTFVSVK